MLHTTSPSLRSSDSYSSNIPFFTHRTSPYMVPAVRHKRHKQPKSRGVPSLGRSPAGGHIFFPNAPQLQQFAQRTVYAVRSLVTREEVPDFGSAQTLLPRTP